MVTVVAIAASTAVAFFLLNWRQQQSKKCLSLIGDGFVQFYRFLKSRSVAAILQYRTSSVGPAVALSSHCAVPFFYRSTAATYT